MTIRDKDGSVDFTVVRETLFLIVSPELKLHENRPAEKPQKDQEPSQ